MIAALLSPGPVLAGPVLAGPVLAGPVLADPGASGPTPVVLGARLWSFVGADLIRVAAAVVAVTAIAVVLRHGGHPVRVPARLWAPEPRPRPQARQVLRIGLGLLWCLDALLRLQPAVPATQVARVFAPGLAAAPAPLATLVQPVATAWSDHPVVADALLVWVEGGLGVLILLGGVGVAAAAVLWLSATTATAAWLLGEFLGGVLTSDSGWLSGVPGSGFGMAAASLLLLLAPPRWWDSGRAGRIAGAAVGGAMLLGGWLQALPGHGYWSGSGLAGIFGSAAAAPQPAALSRPIAVVEQVAVAHPVAVNGAVVVVLTVVGAGLLLRGGRWFSGAGLAVAAATWWWAEDFGVIGGTSTNPGAVVPLALLLLVAWLSAASRAERVPQRPSPVAPPHDAPPHDAPPHDAPPPRRSFPLPWRVTAATAGLLALLAVPLARGVALAGPADADAARAASGGVRSLAPVPLPDFALPDQDGQVVTPATLRGRLTLVTFLDPVCSDNCPVIAAQLLAVRRALGEQARRIQIVAIDTNPIFHERRDVATFTAEHGLASVPDWHFLAGPLPRLTRLLSQFGVAIGVPAVGMISHSQGIFFVSSSGVELSYLEDGAEPAVTTGYVALVTAETRRWLR